MKSNLETPHTVEPVVAGGRKPRIYARSEHPISRAQISDSALKVLYRLHKAGFQACLVGGSVRDLLLGYEPKDFDVATDAKPDQVRELFRNSRLIGRRFRLAHVRFGREIIEVATFRGSADDTHPNMQVSEQGRILRDNVYGNIDDDVWRRDFSANALYYDISDFSVIDYVGGFEDIEAGRLRLIGDPERRYREDPVRMLRAVRFASKLGLTMDPATSEPLERLGHLLEEIAPSRLFDETLKLFHGGAGQQSFETLQNHGLFGRLFPLTDEMLRQPEDGFARRLVSLALANTDRRIAGDQGVTPAFLFAALLWCSIDVRREALIADGHTLSEALRLAADEVISAQLSRIAIPRRFGSVTREIWSLQSRFERRSPKRVARLMEHPRFRAAYDFLLLRSQAGEPVAELADWWTRYQDVTGSERIAMIRTVREKPRGGRDCRNG